MLRNPGEVVQVQEEVQERTYLFRAGSGIRTGREKRVTSYWYDADNLEQAVERFRDEATASDRNCYRVYDVTGNLGNQYSEEQLVVVHVVGEEVQVRMS